MLVDSDRDVSSQSVVLASAATRFLQFRNLRKILHLRENFIEFPLDPSSLTG
jgi:hypothetical protein